MDNFDQAYLRLLEQADAATDGEFSFNEFLNTLEGMQEEYFLTYFAAQVFDPTGVLSYPAFRQAIAAYNAAPDSTYNQGMLFMTFLASIPGLGMGARLIKDVIFKLPSFIVRKFVGIFARSSRLRVDVLPQIFAKGLNNNQTAKYYENLYQAMHKLGIKVSRDDVVKAAQKAGIKVDASFLGKVSKDAPWISKNLKGFAAAAAKTGAGLAKRGSRTATAALALSGAATKYDKESLLDYMKKLPRGRTKQASYGGPALMGGRPNGTYVSPTRQ